MVRKTLFTTPLLYLALALPLAAQTVSISISPTSQTLDLEQTKQFSVSVSGTTNKAVTWTVSGVAGGNATVGTITTGGLYRAPLTLPNPTSVKVRVTSVADRTKFKEATVNLRNPKPTISSLNPSEFNPNSYNLVLTGTKFKPGARIKIGSSYLPTQVVSSTELRAPVTFSAATTACFVVENTSPSAGASSSKCATVYGPVSVKISPTTTTVRGGTTKTFSASVSNTSTKGVDWLVNNIVGGNATVGTISTTGLYTAPMNIAAVGGSVKVAARSQKDASKRAESTVTLQNPVPVLTSISPTSIPIGNTTFTITGNGFAPGATVQLAGRPLNATVLSVNQIRVTGQTQPAPGGIAGLTVSNPAPGPTTSAAIVVNMAPANSGVTYAAAKRFLEQASWGATPTEINRVMQIGFEAWLNEQRTLVESDYTMPTPNGDIPVYDMQAEFFNNAMRKRDQLRQRMAFSLHKILVVSALEVDCTHGLVPYHRTLLKHSLGNFKDLLHDMTLDVAMGQYLDMVNNDKADPSKGTEPNENYAREVMQLFTIGTQFLRADGSFLRDPQGNPYPTYTQDDIMDLSRVFTGWTYPPGKGTDSKKHNKENFGAPMVAVEQNHDNGSKRVLGRTIPAGLTAEQDLEEGLKILFQHPNLGPFIALRLIQSHVTSNPSGAYILRVVNAFNNNGSGVRGDLFAVIKAVLLDPEARVGDNPSAPNPFGSFAGHLRDPLQLTLSTIKGLEGEIVLDNPVEEDVTNMGMKVFYPPSVFSYYSPFSRATGTAFAGPEYQIYTPVNALERVNFIYYILEQKSNSEIKVNIAPYVGLATDVESLIRAIDQHFLHGTMPEILKQGIRDTVATTTDPTKRARLALYLALSSSHYQIAM